MRQRTPRTAGLWTALVLSAFILSFSHPVSAQSFNRDCGAGRLLDYVSGTCGAVEDVLSRSGDLFWVDQRTGSDSNPGTQARPWKTISRANQAGQLTPGDAVLIRAGTYREAIRPRSAGASGALITFAAYPGETVNVSGADVVNRPGTGYTGWTRQSDGSWRHAWQWAPLADEGSYDADRRRELFVVNGAVLRQLSGDSRPAIAPGQFWVEGSDAAPRAVYLRTTDNANPNERTLEVGQRNTLFSPESRDVCTNSVDGFYRLISLRFTHSTASRQRMAVCAGSEGSRLEEIEAVWNNAGGVQIYGRNHLLRGVVASNNGIEGIGGSGCDRCIVEYSDVSNNHWKWWRDEGARAHGGGGKFTRVTNSTFRYNTYVDNKGSGLWLDGHASNNEVYGNYLDGNLKQGIQIEMDSDGNRIFSNVITRTRFNSPIWNGIGIAISTSDDNIIAYNTLILNDGIGVRVGGDNRNDAVGTVIYNNLFIDNIQAADDPSISESRSREIQITGGGPDGGLSPWQRINTMRIDGNAYSYRSPSSVRPDEATFMVSPQSSSGGPLYTNVLREWQDVIGFDVNGMVTNPNLPTVLNALEPRLGWQLSTISQYAEQAVALPSGIAPVPTDFFGNARPLSGGAVGAHQPGGVAVPLPVPPTDPAPGGVVFAVNAGGPAFTAADGTVFAADNGFTGGRTRSTSDAIAGTSDDALYQTERFGKFSYAVPLAPGTYEVTLLFAEFNFTADGARLFDVTIEGEEVVSRLDLYAVAGADTAYDRTFTATVQDGELNVRFVQRVNAPKLSALVVRSTDNATASGETTDNEASTAESDDDARPSSSGLPETFELGGASPNPTRSRATFRYALPELSEVHVDVFDALGRRVAVLAEGSQTAGWHEVTFDGAALPNGVYVVRMEAGGYAATQRFTLVK